MTKPALRKRAKASEFEGFDVNEMNATLRDIGAQFSEPRQPSEVTVAEVALKYNVTIPTARNQLERMVAQGAYVKRIAYDPASNRQAALYQIKP